MDAELKHPAWQVPLHEAISGSRNKRKLLEMETTIVQRLYALTGSGRFDEQQALPIGTANARRGQLLPLQMVLRKRSSSSRCLKPKADRRPSDLWATA